MKHVGIACNAEEQQRPGTGELPMPESYFRSLGMGSRATFYRWGKQGLRVLKIGGRRFIRQSDLTEFLEDQAQ